MVAGTASVKSSRGARGVCLFFVAVKENVYSVVEAFRLLDREADFYLFIYLFVKTEMPQLQAVVI